MSSTGNWSALSTEMLREIANIADEIGPRITKLDNELDEGYNVVDFGFTLEGPDGLEIRVYLGVNTDTEEPVVRFEFDEMEDEDE